MILRMHVRSWEEKYCILRTGNHRFNGTGFPVSALPPSLQIQRWGYQEKLIPFFMELNMIWTLQSEEMKQNLKSFKRRKPWRSYELNYFPQARKVSQKIRDVYEMKHFPNLHIHLLIVKGHGCCLTSIFQLWCMLSLGFHTSPELHRKGKPG